MRGTGQILRFAVSEANFGPGAHMHFAGMRPLFRRYHAEPAISIPSEFCIRIAASKTQAVRESLAALRDAALAAVRNEKAGREHMGAKIELVHRAADRVLKLMDAADEGLSSMPGDVQVSLIANAYSGLVTLSTRVSEGHLAVGTLGQFIESVS